MIVVDLISLLLDMFYILDVIGICLLFWDMFGIWDMIYIFGHVLYFGMFIGHVLYFEI